MPHKNSDYRKYLLFEIITFLIIGLLLSSCNEFSTSIFYTSTPSLTTTPTTTATPTNTITPTITATPKPTRTPRPTPTTVPGIFTNPLNVGDEIVLPFIPESFLNGNNGLGEMSCKLLEVKSGKEANDLAQTELGWLTYVKPIEGQEYLAVRVKLNLIWYKDNNEVETIYPSWSLTLRYKDQGDDIWSVDLIDKIAEGYPPLEGESWVFFLIRADTKPYLYFQPHLMISEQTGNRISGVYYHLDN